MLKELTSQINLGSFYNAIETCDPETGIGIFGLLLSERLIWNYLNDRESTLLAGVGKVMEFIHCISSIHSLHSNKSLYPLYAGAAIVILYNHTVKNPETSYKHQLGFSIGRFLNITAKTVNILAISKMDFYKGPKSSISLLVTIFSVGMSGCNLYSDWNRSAKLPRYFNN